MVLRNAFEDLSVESTQLDVLAALEGTLTNRDAAALPVSTSVTGIATDTVLVAVAPGSRLRLRKFHLHADPALAAETYPVVTLKIGALTVFIDKFEPGLPYAEGIPIEGADGADLTLSVSAVATIYVNVRYDLFS